MTLLICDSNKHPNYVALSTDIVDGVVAGTQPGRTIFFLDTNLWKIVKADKTLDDFWLPISFNGTITIGSTTDGGPSWTSVFGKSGEVASSANASVTPLVITDSPTSGQKIVLDDFEISVDTAMIVTLRTTTGNKVLGKYYLPANFVGQITTRGKKKAPVADQTLEVVTSASGNISVGANYHSEA